MSCPTEQAGMFIKQACISDSRSCVKGCSQDMALVGCSRESWAPWAELQAGVIPTGK